MSSIWPGSTSCYLVIEISHRSNKCSALISFMTDISVNFTFVGINTTEDAEDLGLGDDRIVSRIVT